MSIQSEIDRIEQNIANTYTALSELGADMPTPRNSDNLAQTVETAKAVLYIEQTLTEEQQTQARRNIGAPSAKSVPAVPSWALEPQKPSYTKSEVGLGNVDNVKQYSASNPPPYPVTKVNGKTGAVSLSAVDVGAVPDASIVQDTGNSTTKVMSQAAVTRELDKLTNEKADYVTPEMFGAVGDGVTDDTAAFQALDGKYALLSAKTYCVSKVSYGAKTHLVGAGMNKTIIQQIAGTLDDMIVVTDGDGSGLENMSLLGTYDTETDTVGTHALLKIKRSGDSVYSSRSVYRALDIRKAASSGLYLAGGKSLDGSTQPMNFVLQMNNIRCGTSHWYSMIDESCDNRFSQFYINGGQKGGLLLYYASSNTYSDFKVDWSGASGADAELTGALLIAKGCSGLNFSNFDLQSARYCGAKFTDCKGIRFAGDINNCGVEKSTTGYAGRCLQLNATSNSQFNFVAYSVDAPQTYNVVIDAACANVDCNIQEVYVAPNINDSPVSCSISKSSALAANFNAKIAVSDVISNKFKNPDCASTSGWTLTSGRVTQDSAGKIAGAYSFYVDSTATTLSEISQTVRNLTVGDVYLVACVVDIASVDDSGSSSKVPYINVQSVDGLGHQELYTIKRYASNTTGKQVLCRVTRLQYDTLKFQLFSNKNTCKFYAGNFVCLRMSDLLGMANPSEEAARSLYDYMAANLGTIFSSVDYSLGFGEIVSLVAGLKDRKYGADNPPSYPVVKVNGKTGAVSLSAADVGARSNTWLPTASEVGALPAGTKIPAKTSDLTNDSGFLTGYTETDPTVPAWAKASSKPSYTKSEVGLGNVDNVKQYSASNPPPYPVTSVNGKTGAVTLSIPTVPTKLSGFTNDLTSETWTFELENGTTVSKVVLLG